MDEHARNEIGIAHSRWASHGGINDRNSHPHIDVTERFALVHNGVIENHKDIRKFLSDHNIECDTDTDTETIVQLIYYYSQENNFEDAVKLATDDLEGTWGLVILDRENPNSLITVRHGSPLLVGLNEDEIFVASEVAAFQKYTTKYFSLNNDEILTIVREDDGIILNVNPTDRIKSMEQEEILITPDPYPHWTLREIMLQPDTIQAALNNGARILDDDQVLLGGLERNKIRLLSIKNLVIVGCGTSFNAGLYGSNIFRLISGFDTVQVIDASEFTLSHINNTRHVGILALSQSGETKDVMRCLEEVGDKIVTFSVVNRVGSQVARTTNCGVYLNAGREVGVASTKAFTAQVTVLSMISIWFGQNRGINPHKRMKLINNIENLSDLYSEILNDQKIQNVCDQIAKYLVDHNTCFILGKEKSAYIAYEGALKIKEIGYIHAEGYPGGSLKHGPFALIEKGTPIILIVLDDRDRSYMESTVSEVKARGAYSIVITNIEGYEDGDVNIVLPENGRLSALLAVIPLQLISYKLSIYKGIDCDKPKNLAKTVTII